MTTPIEDSLIDGPRRSLRSPLAEWDHEKSKQTFAQIKVHAWHYIPEHGRWNMGRGAYLPTKRASTAARARRRTAGRPQSQT